MSARILSGQPAAERIRADVGRQVEELTQLGREATLAIVTANDDESSSWYVRSLVSSAAKLGVNAAVHDLGPCAGEVTIRATLERLSTDHAVHGIILQTPLPGGIDLGDVARAISPEKDVDGANPVSLGLLAAGLQAFAPATAEAVMTLLDEYQIDVEGREAVIVGRSAVVGKPLFHLLLNKNATITVCHSRSSNLQDVTRRADVVVAAVGKARLLTSEHVAPGAVVIDVGTNADPKEGLVGDVDANDVGPLAAALSPVPGGVGAVTTSLLLLHTTSAALRAQGQNFTPAGIGS
ncbi:bifunctional 5,10-methylenetetrahydrofolate dehydrogenase/5,10-methenyltetrahydrofolate cyclohydrolase [Specibacter cremeus]|uniref:bifunctional 5,10-methylenetetrahydrofolate dehydrogenase/5,10-methenyltetrahydrofolate cyclohydrolase n=1 Tax=Specibacter cremeus TaxID=1629051 RepID=UPI000F7B7F19|nr:bifunctional 5,10-methylenetetrahydrofolate dehydrogenase/5,10-methenyltetrahydrofolate cyclohydrolase [Specibacter cremeus]